MAGNEHIVKRLRYFLMCLGLGLWAGLSICAGCAGHHMSPRTAQRLDDKVIADNVETALHAASANAFAQVRVMVQDGGVRLGGSVANAQAKSKAAQVAKGVEHVREVDNQLQIREFPGR